MPIGKIASRYGGSSVTRKVPVEAIATDMLKYKKDLVSPTSQKEIREISIALEEAFHEYQIKHKVSNTATSRRRIVRLIERRATKLYSQPDSDVWRLKLLDALLCTLEKAQWRCSSNGTRRPRYDHDLRTELVRLLNHLNRQSNGKVITESEFRRKLENNRALDTDDLEVLHVLANLSEHIQVSQGRWRDPELFRLVVKVVPIWKNQTGRSTKPTSTDATAVSKHNLFAQWLRNSLVKIGLEAPPDSRVTDIVRDIEKN